MKFRELKLERDPACPLCGPHRTIHALIDYEAFCGIGAGAASGAEAAGAPVAITATELKRRIDTGEAVQIVDVREPHEAAIARIPGARLMPLGEVVARAGELDPGREAIVHCKGGTRSAKAIAVLREAGYEGPLVNLAGGILAWSREVDPSVPTY